jgi:hypothetical protein
MAGGSASNPSANPPPGTFRLRSEARGLTQVAASVATGGGLTLIASRVADIAGKEFFAALRDTSFTEETNTSLDNRFLML